jgi:formate--tetrahydrofolate ligase
LSDLDIAQQVPLTRIADLVTERLGIDGTRIEAHGHYKAKLPLDLVESLADRPDGKLILVTGVSPTPAGEGKTTTTIGLGDGLNAIGKRALICLRQPSLGPCFGAKGGATGGGHAQVVPMEDINLHFTGDFHAISLAHNLLSTLVDNHIHFSHQPALDTRRLLWKRVVDLNDRSLRNVTIGLGGVGNGYPREDGFDIVPASEVMAILCLATSIADLKTRLGNILVGYSRDGAAVHARDLNAHGAMAVLLRDAIKPNIVQTLEKNLAFIHGGPFGNIAHGCNSVIATRTALKLADYVVTEAGFGADLGAEKFVDIKCRKSGLRPAAAVIVATMRALKFHGGADKGALDHADLRALERGIPNLERHINNVRNHFGLPCVVAVNRFVHDTAAEIKLLTAKIAHHGVETIVSDHWAKGGAGAAELAREVVKLIDHTPADFRFVYDDDDTLWEKIGKVATNIYGASEVIANTKVRVKIKHYQEEGYGRFPVCIAKTQYSFSSDPLLRGAPSHHVLPISDVRLSAGAEFLVVLCGDIMTMPGLPKFPRSAEADLDDAGRIVGLF